MRLSPRIRKRIRLEFFPEDHTAALQLLSGWQTRRCAPGESGTRMQTAVLNMAHGHLPTLQWAITTAEGDFRDVLLWGEDRQFAHLRCVSCAPGAQASNPFEEAFLAAIRASPHDNGARLIYADWLEERGDARAEYLRVLCDWLTCHPPSEPQ